MLFLNEEQWAEASRFTHFFDILQSYFILFISWGKLLLSRTYGWEKRGSDVKWGRVLEIRHLLNSPSLLDLFSQASSQISLFRGVFLDYSIRKKNGHPLFQCSILFSTYLSLSPCFFLFIYLLFCSFHPLEYQEGDLVSFVECHIPVLQQFLTSNSCSKTFNRWIHATLYLFLSLRNGV